MKRASLRVILSGGMGNQLFQYAAGRALAERTGVELVLDTISGFKDDTTYKRSYELDVFPGPRSCRKVDRPSKRAWWWLRLRNRKGMQAVATLLKIVDEGTHGPVFQELTLGQGETLLTGFWQGETYFSALREQLQQELAFSETELRDVDEIAVHVRRVQYTRGVGEAFFEQAMAALRERVHAPQFTLFTDDLDWGERFAASRSDVTCGSHSSAGPLDDFQAMASFQNLIISNSTFSWWAAWLQEPSDAHILSPGRKEWANPNTPPQRWLEEQT